MMMSPSLDMTSRDITISDDETKVDAVHMCKSVRHLRKLIDDYISSETGGGDLASPHVPPSFNISDSPILRLSRPSLVSLPLVSVGAHRSHTGRRMQLASPLSPSIPSHTLDRGGSRHSPRPSSSVGPPSASLVCTTPTPRQTESEKRADPRVSKRYTSSDQKRPDVDRSEGYRSIQTWKGASIRVSGAPYLTRIDLKKADFRIPTC